MKSFSCKDVIPGCTTTFEGQTEEEILHKVIDHAKVDHKLTDISDDVLKLVRAKIRELE